MVVLNTLIKNKGTNSIAISQYLANRQEGRPQRARGCSYWTAEAANAWKFRNEYGTECETEPTWIVSTDESWWSAIWVDITGEHGERSASKFWRTFNNSDAKEARKVALIGTKAANWSGAVVAFNSANHEAYDRKILLTDEFLKSMEMDLIAAEIWLSKRDPNHADHAKEFLGIWLYDVIRAGDHGQIRKLSDLVSGKAPPETPNLEGTEKFQILDGFASLLVEHFRLPTKSELFERITAFRRGKGNFPKLVKDLGLNGLPGRMPKEK